MGVLPASCFFCHSLLATLGCGTGEKKEGNELKSLPPVNQLVLDGQA